MPETQQKPIQLPGVRILDLENFIDKRVEDKLDAVFDRHLNDLRALVASGFPSDDPHGHRTWHQEQIEFMKSRREFYESIRNKTIAGIVWAGLVGVGGLILTGLKAMFNAQT